MKNNTNPNLSPYLFWDCNQKTVDYKKNYAFVIERVLERGSLSDWQRIKTFYGLEKIKEAALNAKLLTERTLSFCSVVFNVPQNKFKCYGKSMFP